MDGNIENTQDRACEFMNGLASMIGQYGYLAPGENPIPAIVAMTWHIAGLAALSGRPDVLDVIKSTLESAYAEQSKALCGGVASVN